MVCQPTVQKSPLTLPDGSHHRTTYRTATDRHLRKQRLGESQTQQGREDHAQVLSTAIILGVIAWVFLLVQSCRQWLRMYCCTLTCRIPQQMIDRPVRVDCCPSCCYVTIRLKSHPKAVVDHLTTASRWSTEPDGRGVHTRPRRGNGRHPRRARRDARWRD